MQEEVENRTVTLSINATKLTGRVFKAAIMKYAAHLKGKVGKDVQPRGKQSVKKLIGQNQGVTSVDLADKSTRDFDKVARKYGVDYAIKKDKSTDPPRYLVFFKARDGDALKAAMSEYANKQLAKQTKSSKPSLLKRLQALGELVKDKMPKDRHKNKEHER